MINATYQSAADVAESLREDARELPSESNLPARSANQQMQQSANLTFDPTVRTQTGPARPAWSGNEILCRWDGPVTSDQLVSPIYITRTMHRTLTLVRCVLLLLLAALLIRMRPFFETGRKRKRLPQTAATAIAMLLFIPAGTSYGQFPDKEMLDTLRQRLMQTSDSFPDAANIASLEVLIQDVKLQMNLEVHAASEVAIPLPGKLPMWSPISVRLADAASVDVPVDSVATSQTETTQAENLANQAVVCRHGDGYLWVVISCRF